MIFRDTEGTGPHTRAGLGPHRGFPRRGTLYRKDCGGWCQRIEWRSELRQGRVGGHRGRLIRNQRSTPPITMMPHVNGAMPRMNVSAAYTACHIESVSTSVITSVLAGQLCRGDGETPVQYALGCETSRPGLRVPPSLQFCWCHTTTGMRWRPPPSQSLTYRRITTLPLRADTDGHDDSNDGRDHDDLLPHYGSRIHTVSATPSHQREVTRETSGSSRSAKIKGNRNELHFRRTIHVLRTTQAEPQRWAGPAAVGSGRKTALLRES